MLFGTSAKKLITAPACSSRRISELRGPRSNETPGLGAGARFSYSANGKTKSTKRPVPFASVQREQWKIKGGWLAWDREKGHQRILMLWQKGNGLHWGRRERSFWKDHPSLLLRDFSR